MAGSKSLGGAELWPVPGFVAMGALKSSGGVSPVALAGPKNAPEVLIVAGQSLEVVRGLARHSARKGLGVLALAGTPGPDADEILRAALELAQLRGGERFALVAHGGWANAALLAAAGTFEALAVIDPLASEADPQRLSGIPLWIASGTESAPAARALHVRARHPRALIELPSVARLDHAVSDVAAELVPFLCHALANAR